MNSVTNAKPFNFLAPTSVGLAAGVIKPSPAGKRLAREHKTMAAIIQSFCRGRHGVHGQLCPECRDLLEYASVRLERCRFAEAKPTCANCPVHCYQTQRREQIKVVMRYAGPRMLWQHPILALRHWLDGYKPAPAVARNLADRGQCT